MSTKLEERKRPLPTNPQQPEPAPPFPKQHLEKPGIESKLEPRPRYQAALRPRLEQTFKGWRARGVSARKLPAPAGASPKTKIFLLLYSRSAFSERVLLQDLMSQPSTSTTRVRRVDRIVN